MYFIITDEHIQRRTEANEEPGEDHEDVPTDVQQSTSQQDENTPLSQNDGQVFPSCVIYTKTLRLWTSTF